MLVAIGQALFAFGVSIRSYPVALIGRCIFGLGGESLNISQFNSILSWFGDEQISMALSVAATFNRITTAVNDNSTPTIAEHTNLDFGLWVGFMLCIVSLLASFWLRFLNRKKNLLLGKPAQDVIPESEKFHMRDIKSFSLSLWLLALNCSFIYSAVYCFNNVASNYFQKRFGYSTVEGGHIISITFIICGLFCPVFGVLLDRYGGRIYYIMSSGVLVCLAHCLFLSTPDSNKPIAPILYMIPLGLGFSMSSAVVWASISYVVSRGSGTGYGIVLAMVDTFLVINPICVGYIKDNTSKYHGYYWVSFFLIFIGVSGTLASVFLYFQNKRDGARLFGSLREVKPAEINDKESIE